MAGRDIYSLLGFVVFLTAHLSTRYALRLHDRCGLLLCVQLDACSENTNEHTWYSGSRCKISKKKRTSQVGSN